MATATLTGSVSGEVGAGETVTWTITNPDATTTVVTATTLADLSFTATATITQVGDYKSALHIDKDATFTAADGTTNGFTVQPTARTISGTVAVT